MNAPTFRRQIRSDDRDKSYMKLTSSGSSQGILSTDARRMVCTSCWEKVIASEVLQDLSNADVELELEYQCPPWRELQNLSKTCQLCDVVLHAVTKHKIEPLPDDTLDVTFHFRNIFDTELMFYCQIGKESGNAYFVCATDGVLEWCSTAS